VNLPVSALETLKSEKGKCAGYSRLVAAFCRSIGIPAKVVEGMVLTSKEVGQGWNSVDFKAPPAHAWNEVWAEGRWITLDATWDSGGLDSVSHVFKPKLTEEYFDPSPGTFALDHYKTLETQD
jgi:transglutaminase/protease-like cytokinesis protein 3